MEAHCLRLNSTSIGRLYNRTDLKEWLYHLSLAPGSVNLTATTLNYLRDFLGQYETERFAWRKNFITDP